MGGATPATAPLPGPENDFSALNAAASVEGVQSKLQRIVRLALEHVRGDA